MDCAENSKENYRLYECVGRGGFGEVYRAKSLLTGQECALKLIEKKTMAKKGMLKRVLNEVEIHSRLKHPSILELYSYFEDSNYIYLDLEYCPKGDLQSALRRRKKGFNERQVQDLMRQVVEGISYLQRHKIVHRDLKLSNILISKNDSLKIADFGLAIQLQEDGEKHNTMCGTLNYISPEVLSRDPHGLEVDLWSLGCMFFNLLTGKTPFEGGRVKGTMERVREGNFSVPSYISQHASDLIHLILQKNPDERLKLEHILCHPFFQQSPPENTSLFKKKDRHSEEGRLTPPTPSLPLSIPDQSHAFNTSNNLLQPQKNPISPVLSSKPANPVTSLFCGSDSQDELFSCRRNYEELLTFDILPNKTSQNINSSEEDKGFTSSTSLAMRAFNSSTPLKCSKEKYSDLESSFSSKNYDILSAKSPSILQSFNLGQEFKADENSAGSFNEQNTPSCFLDKIKNISLGFSNASSQTGLLKKSQASMQDCLRQAKKSLLETDMRHLPPTHNPSSPLTKSISFENMHKLSQKPAWRTVELNFEGSFNNVSNLHQRNSRNMIENFSTARLRPMHHKAKNAYLTIEQDGTLYGEFFRVTNSEDKVYKVLKISNEKKAYLLEPKPPSKPCSYPSFDNEAWTYCEMWDLPQGWRSKLEYLCHFVSLVRSKTPKITIYTARAKCMLMENLPIPDFQVDFHTGYRYLVTDKQTTIREADNSLITLTSPSKAKHLSPQLLAMWNYVVEMHESCKALENLTINSNSSFSCFPLTLGRKSFFGSMVSSSSSSSSKSSKEIKNLPVETMLWSERLAKESPRGSEDNDDNFSKVYKRWVSKDRLVFPKQLATPNNHQNSSLKGSLSKSYSEIQTLSSGTVTYKTSDGSQVSIDCTSSGVIFTDATGQRVQFNSKEGLPGCVAQSMEELERMMVTLEQSKRSALSLQHDARELHV